MLGEVLEGWISSTISHSRPGGNVPVAGELPFDPHSALRALELESLARVGSIGRMFRHLAVSPAANRRLGRGRREVASRPCGRE
jgi:hypothetical protein